MSTVSRNEEFSTGYGSARVTSSGYLYNVVVNEGHRGQGHGHALMRKITASADADGRTLYTQARPELHGFYGKHGFIPSAQSGLGDLPMLERTPR